MTTASDRQTCRHDDDAEAGIGVCPSCRSVILRPLRSEAGIEHGAAFATPLVRSRLAENLFLKWEGANPTGTFKDRIMGILVAEAVARSAPGAVVASSGNAAVAAASAAARRGLPLLALVPTNIPDTRRAMLSSLGAAVMEVGHHPAAAYGLARFIARHTRLAELPSTFHASGAEYACRSIGHEIVDQLGEPPDALAAAVSVGPVLVGSGSGIRERTGRHVTLLGGQAAGCSPIAAAFATGAAQVTAWTDPIDSTATSIADPLIGYEHEATFFLDRVRASGGFVHAWPDGDLLDAQRELLAVDGIGVEMSSAAGLLAALDHRTTGPVVAILTGGLTRTAPDGSQPVPIDEFSHRASQHDLQEVIETWHRTQPS